VSVVSITHEQNVIFTHYLHMSMPLSVGSYLQVTWWALSQSKGWKKNASNDKIHYSYPQASEDMENTPLGSQM